MRSEFKINLPLASVSSSSTPRPEQLDADVEPAVAPLAALIAGFVEPMREMMELGQQRTETGYDKTEAGFRADLTRKREVVEAFLAASRTAGLRSSVALTGPAVLRVGGIYQANALIGSYLVSAGFFLAHFPPQPPGGLLLRTGGSSAAASTPS